MFYFNYVCYKIESRFWFHQKLEFFIYKTNMFDLVFFKILLSCFIKYSVKKTFGDFYKNKSKDILASAQRKKKLILM